MQNCLQKYVRWASCKTRGELVELSPWAGWSCCAPLWHHKGITKFHNCRLQHIHDKKKKKVKAEQRFLEQKTKQNELTLHNTERSQKDEKTKQRDFKVVGEKKKKLPDHRPSVPKVPPDDRVNAVTAKCWPRSVQAARDPSASAAAQDIVSKKDVSPAAPAPQLISKPAPTLPLPLSRH